MTFSKIAAAGAAAAALLGGSSATASVLYDNGPLDGTKSAWTIAYGYAVADSFTLTSASTLTGVTFGVWTFGSDTISTVDWGITTAANTYPVSGTAAVTNGATVTNGYGYSIGVDSFSTGPVSLAAGAYYLVLQNAAVTNGDPAYWDINNGPSVGYENTIGDTNGVLFPGSNSSSFQIIGSTGVPEPATWALMLTGFGSLGAALRGRRKTVAA